MRDRLDRSRSPGSAPTTSGPTAGYPDGLAAQDIPDGAAILGVADAYDAMTVARPYSAPLLAAEALEECRRLSGAQFDPDAVEALEAVLDRTSRTATPAAGARAAPEARR